MILLLFCIISGDVGDGRSIVLIVVAPMYDTSEGIKGHFSKGKFTFVVILLHLR